MASLQSLFLSLVELPESERGAFLDHATAGDPELRSELIGLLQADQALAHRTLQIPVAAPEAWAAVLVGTALKPGERLGAFRICEPLGQGGMGVVFRAERFEGSVEQQVAIKIVRRQFLDPDTRQRFELERQALATLDHPYIARLIDAAELPDGTPYFVMELVDGIPIDVHCASHLPTVRARVELMRQVCQAVAHAHQHLIVHRDLKPGNILVGRDCLPKLLDFGIAKSIGAALGPVAHIQTLTAQHFLSPRYAAPEQFRGGQVHVGCDVYALGVLLFELLSGQTPFDFEGLSLGQIEQLISTVAAPPPSSRMKPLDAAGRARQRALRGDLDGIVLKCLRKSAAERYESVAQLDEDLSRWLQGQPVQARHGHRWYRWSKFAARHRMAVVIAAGAVLALAVAALALWQQNLALREERDVSRQALSLMQDAFVAADPIRAAGADISARQILESARQRLAVIADTQPRLYITLAQAIARVELSLGESVEAAALLDRASALAAAAGVDLPTRVQMRVLQARALINADHFTEAQQALDQAQRLSGDPGPHWRAVQGRLWSLTQPVAAGVQLLSSAVNELAAVGPDDEQATSARYALAEAQGIAGDAQAELATLDRALEWQGKSFDPAHPLLLRTRLRRLIALRAAGRAEASVSEAQAVLRDVLHIFGEHTPEAAYVYNALGRSLESLARPEEALEAYRNALQATIRVYGRDHANTARVQFNLAYTLGEHGQHDVEAEMLFQEALTQTEQRSGADSEMASYYRIYFAQFLASRQRALQAFELLTLPAAASGLSKLSPDNRDAYLQTLNQLAAVLNCPATAAVTDAVVARPEAQTGLALRCQRAADWLQQTASAAVVAP